VDAVNLSPEDLNKIIGSDFLIIAFEQNAVTEQIRNNVISLGMQEGQILNFYPAFRSHTIGRVVDRVMSNPNIDSYEGLVFGLSHACCSIDPSLLDNKWAMCSIHSADLYYNLKALEYCIDRYLSKIRNLKYVLIDMFDYSYLNYDSSLSSMALHYLMEMGGGDFGPHHLADNKAMEGYTYEDVMNYVNSLNAGTIGAGANDVDLWNTLLHNYVDINSDILYNNEMFLSANVKSLTQDTINSMPTFPTGLLKRRYE